MLWTDLATQWWFSCTLLHFCELKFNGKMAVGSGRLGAHPQTPLLAASAPLWLQPQLPPHWATNPCEARDKAFDRTPVLVPSAAPRVFVIKGHPLFVFAAELPRYQSSILNCRASMVSLFNTEDKSLSSKQNVRAAFVFLGTFFFTPSNRKTQTGFHLLQRKWRTKGNLCFLFLLPFPLPMCLSFYAAHSLRHTLAKWDCHVQQMNTIWNQRKAAHSNIIPSRRFVRFLEE